MNDAPKTDPSLAVGEPMDDYVAPKPLSAGDRLAALAQAAQSQGPQPAAIAAAPTAVEPPPSTMEGFVPPDPMGGVYYQAPAEPAGAKAKEPTSPPASQLDDKKSAPTPDLKAPKSVEGATISGDSVAPSHVSSSQAPQPPTSNTYSALDVNGPPLVDYAPPPALSVGDQVLAQELAGAKHSPAMEIAAAPTAVEPPPSTMEGFVQPAADTAPAQQAPEENAPAGPSAFASVDPMGNATGMPATSEPAMEDPAMGAFAMTPTQTEKQIADETPGKGFLQTGLDIVYHTGMLAATTADGATMGVGTKALGAVAGAATWVTGNGFEAGYDTVAGGSEAALASYAKENPTAAKVAYWGGVVGATVGTLGAGAAARAGVVVGKAALGATEGVAAAKVLSTSGTATARFAANNVLMAGAAANSVKVAAQVPKAGFVSKLVTGTGAALWGGAKLLGRGAKKTAGAGVGYLAEKTLNAGMAIGGKAMDMAALAAALTAIAYIMQRANGVSHEQAITNVNQFIGDVAGDGIVGSTLKGGANLLTDNKHMKGFGDMAENMLGGTGMKPQTQFAMAPIKPTMFPGMGGH